MSFDHSPGMQSRFRWSGADDVPPAPDTESVRGGAGDGAGVFVLQVLAGVYTLLHLIGVFVIFGQIQNLTYREQDARFGLYMLLIYTALMLPTLVLAIAGDGRASVYVTMHTGALLLLSLTTRAEPMASLVVLVALVVFGILTWHGFTAAGEREYMAETRYAAPLKRQETRIRQLEKDLAALRTALHDTQLREPSPVREETP